MALTDNTRAAALMVGSMSAFTVNDAFVKLLGQDLPLMQLVCLRGLMVSAILLLFLRIQGGFRLGIPARDRWLVALRAWTEVLTTFFFLTALINMPIANVTAILQALPLTVALAGALFLGEPIGWRRLLAILIGFVGVMLIVRPGTEGFTVYSVYALVAVCLITLRDLVTRQLSPAVPSMTVALATAATVTVAAGVVSSFQPWSPVGQSQAALLLAAAVSILFGYLLSVMVMRVGEIGFVAPFRYSSLVVALILGYLVFGDWPDPATLLGAAIVVATGGFTLWREHRQAEA